MKACGRDENDVIASSSEFIKGDVCLIVMLCCVADNNFQLGERCKLPHSSMTKYRVGHIITASTVGLALITAPGMLKRPN